MTLPHPSTIAFLSGLGADTTNTNPGLNAGWTSTNPSGRGSGWTNTNPSGSSSGWTNTNPGGRNSGWTSTNPRGRSEPAQGDGSHAGKQGAFDPQAFPSWEGLDAPWTYFDDQSLLTQALRKTRAKLNRPSDERPPFGAAQVQPNAKKEPLWRWAPEFRSHAVCGELHSRLAVHGKQVWLVEPPAVKSAKAQGLIAVPDAKAMAAAKVDMSEQVDSVMRAAIEREDRLPEILSQAVALWPFFESVTGVQLSRAPAFAELLTSVEDWIVKVLMLLKHEVAAHRPVRASSMIMPLIQTPGHGSLPSGHATQAAFNAEILCFLMYHDNATGKAYPDDQVRIDVLDRLARRIAFNRVVAGVHFPVDSLVGYKLGRQLARAVATLAGVKGLAMYNLDAAAVLGAPRHTLREVEDGSKPNLYLRQRAPVAAPARAPALRTLWNEARDELARQRV